MIGLGNIWSKAQIGLGIAVAILMAIGVAFLRGRAAGIQHLEAEQAKRRIEAMKARKEIEYDVENLGAADVDERLAQWVRDDPKR